MRVHAVRLEPGHDLKQSLLAYCEAHDLASAWILTAVGSLRSANIRLAHHDKLLGAGSNAVLTLPDQKFEICSLVGTISRAGASCHLHVSLADRRGDCVGGHVLEGNVVFTTCEIVLGSSSTMTFERELDERTGYDELVVREASAGAETTAGEMRGKAARRARQLRAEARERELRAEAGERERARGLFEWLVNVVVPRPGMTRAERDGEEEEEEDAPR
jgi:predicted DNA-binding protein with PD1-like motif